MVQEDGRLYCQGTLDDLGLDLFPTSKSDFFAFERPEAISFIAGTEENIEAVMQGEYLRLEKINSWCTMAFCAVQSHESAR